MNATPIKLKDGSWGARVQGTVNAGDNITVRTKAGKEWVATVGRIVWKGDGVAIVTTQKQTSNSASGRNWNRDAFNGYGKPRGGYRKACVSDGNCSSFGSGKSCGGFDCDGY